MTDGASTSGGPVRGRVGASTVAFLASALWLLAGCGNRLGEPIPNDPHPVWVCFESSWYRFDQHGHRMGRFAPHDRDRLLGVNPATGDIWAARDYPEGELVIYDEAGRRRSFPGLRYVHAVAFDTKAGAAWVAGLERPEERGDEATILRKYDYEGRLLLETRVSSEFDWIYEADVYEEAGELWLATWRKTNKGTDEDIVKFDADGNLLFSKPGRELGVGCPNIGGLFVDRADGGVWLYDDYNRTLGKIGRDGNPLGSWEIPHRLLDVGRRTGDRLCLQYRYENDRGARKLAPKYYTEDQLHLYNRDGVKLWSAPVPSCVGACISDADGAVWYVRRTNGPYDNELGKFSREGGHVIREVPVGDEYRFDLIAVRGDPYGEQPRP